MDQSGAPPGAGGSSLIIRNARPLDAESPLEALRTFETKNDLFFVRGHHAPPGDVSTPWTLTIDGDVARPITLQLEDVRRMRAERRPRDDRVRRKRPRPVRAAGDFRRAVGARRGEHRDMDWRAARCVARTRRRSAVRTALLDGGCRSQPAARLHRSSSAVFLAKQRSADALVAYEMNGQPVPFLHGGPLRLVMPRWFGMASTKWLTHVHARPTESDNHFMVRGYRYADGSAVDLMRVKSLITAPRDGEQVPARYRARVRRRMDGLGDDREGRDLERRWTDVARGAMHQRTASGRLAAVGSRRRRSGPPASSACVRARPTRPAHTQPDRATPNPARLRKQFDPGGARHCLLMPRFARRFACRRCVPPHEGRSSPRSSRPSSPSDAEAPASTGRLIRIRD